MKLAGKKINRNLLNNSIKKGFALFMCLLCFSLLSLTVFATNAPDNVIKVGFFDFEGYHETDSQNRRSGYGYEYLHEMAKYTGWVFEYVDGTWDECQEMLKNGKIDILTSAQYSEERDEFFDFSSTSMGTSYAQLTVASTNTSLDRNDFSGFNGIKIGLIKGNSRNESLAEFAAGKSFTYVPTIYETQTELDSALKTGAVDAVLTSSLRKPHNEKIIAQFSPSPFYAIVKEGNKALLDQIDLALESIEMNNPAFRYNLYQEYYRVDTANTFVLSSDENEYLASHPKIRAVIRPGVAPISYYENGEFKGISADVMDYLLDGLNVDIEYIYPNSLKEGYQMMKNGNADIVCLFESDYNLAEQYNARITTTYLNTNYSIISRQDSNKNLQAAQTIAIPDGALIGTRYAQTHYPNAQIIPVATNHSTIEAVSNGDADIALVNVYSAEKELANFPNLRASFVSDEEQQFSIGVSQSTDIRLYSILDKKINSMESTVFSDILSRHTMFKQTSMSLTEYFRQHPFQIILSSALIFLAIIGVLLYIVIINKKHAKKIYSLAYIDELTNLWNTNGFILHGKALLSKYPDDNFVVVSIDLSKFSAVNENYGRASGDKLIQGMGAVINRFSNDKAIVAHSEADHFLMLLSYKNENDIRSTLSAISGVLSTQTLDDLTLRFNAHVGVGSIEKQENALILAIDHANSARCKCDPDHQIIFMDKSLQNNLLREKEIQGRVEFALEKEEFQAYYQPKVDMVNHKIIGAEALVRWNHGVLGFLSPAEFIPILEQSGIITEVDFFILEQACKLIRKWLDDGVEPVVISVNQSRANFLKSNYIERLQNMIIKYNIPNGKIELEITETMFGQESISNTIIKKIKSIGLLISIDDFGSGYSSLYLLHQISVDILKIDKGLLDEGGKHEKVRNIIKRIVQIADDLDVAVICEGVETKEQVDFLLGIGCNFAQGFLYSKPLPQAEFETFLQSDDLIR